MSFGGEQELALGLAIGRGGSHTCKILWSRGVLHVNGISDKKLPSQQVCQLQNAQTLVESFVGVSIHRCTVL